MTAGWWQAALGIVGGVVLLWVLLIVLVWRERRRHPERQSLGELLRMIPDVLRLLRRLVGDRTVPRGVRVWLVVLVAYLISPIDLIPDFIPVVGYADDALIVAIAVRFALRHAGSAAIERHWPGTPDGLSAVLRLSGLTQ
jgi:uncharacterized membrane protein YkvA (DUF1232 family)